ncbi:MAG: glycosyltransferase family 39 protein [Candidatus Omnitrophica bacterium]|nr:glycosyltransferase family 39 protein [Candidatus Omnitrophota bacterium]
MHKLSFQYLWNNRIAWSLFIVVIMGAGLRLWGLDVQSFWNDELGSWGYGHQSSLSKVIERVVSSDVNPPGYYVLLYYIEKFGDSEVVLRLPSAVCGILSIVMIFLIGKRLFSWREGIVASVFMAFSWCPVFYSQEARAYAFLLLFSCLSVYFWLAIVERLRTKDRVSSFAIMAYLAAAVIACYVHYYGVYLVAIEGIAGVVLFCRSGRNSMFFFYIYAVIVVAYLPWLYIFWQRLFVHPSGEWILAPRGVVDSFIWYLKFIFDQSMFYILVVGGAYLFLLARVVYERSRSYIFEYSVLIGWLVLPFMGVWSISYFTPLHILENRYLIISLPAAYLLVARAVVLLPLNALIKRLSVVALAVFLIWDLIFRLQYYSIPSKEQFREAVNFVIQHDGHYKDSIIVGSVWNEECLDYYFRRGNFNKHVGYLLSNQAQREELFRVLAGNIPVNIWYVHMNEPCDNEFLAYVNKLMMVVEHKDFLGGSVYLFQKRDLRDGS